MEPRGAIRSLFSGDIGSAASEFEVPAGTVKLWVKLSPYGLSKSDSLRIAGPNGAPTEWNIPGPMPAGEVIEWEVPYPLAMEPGTWTIEQNGPSSLEASIQAVFIPQ